MRGPCSKQRRRTAACEPVSEELADFAAAVRDVPELRSPCATRSSRRATKVAVLDELVGDADQLIRNFLRLVAEKGRIGQIEEIAREFDRLMAREERRLNVELTTARELSAEEARDLLQQIEQRIRSQGRGHAQDRPESDRRLRPAGGSMRVDASVRGRLEGLRQELSTSRSL